MTVPSADGNASPLFRKQGLLGQRLPFQSVVFFVVAVVTVCGDCGLKGSCSISDLPLSRRVFSLGLASDPLSKSSSCARLVVRLEGEGVTTLLARKPRHWFEAPAFQSLTHVLAKCRGKDCHMKGIASVAGITAVGSFSEAEASLVHQKRQHSRTGPQLAEISVTKGSNLGSETLGKCIQGFENRERAALQHEAEAQVAVDAPHGVTTCASQAHELFTTPLEPPHSFGFTVDDSVADPQHQSHGGCVSRCNGFHSESESTLIEFGCHAFHDPFSVSSVPAHEVPVVGVSCQDRPAWPQQGRSPAIHQYLPLGLEVTSAHSHQSTPHPFHKGRVAEKEAPGEAHRQGLQTRPNFFLRSNRLQLPILIVGLADAKLASRNGPR